METSSKLLALVLALVSLISGCGPGCDEAGLLRARAALVGGGPDARRAGVTALAEACPGLPRALQQGLVGAEGFDEAAITRDDEPRWWELLARTCPDLAETDARSMTIADLESVMRRECELGAHGLLAPDELFAGRDVSVFMLHEWLIGRRVDRGLAAELARPLLASQALAGLRPPRGTVDLPVRGGGPAIRLSATTVAVDGTTLVMPVAGAFTEHVSPQLREVLAPRAAALRVRPDVRFTAPRTAVVADRATPFAVFADTLFTATRAGFMEFELVVTDGQQLAGQPVGVPDAWLGIFDEPDTKIDRALDFSFVVHTYGLEVRIAGGEWKSVASPATCEPAPAACHDLATVAKLATNLKASYPNEALVQLRVDGDVPMQAVVSLIDAVRGEGCRLRGAFKGEAVLDACKFFMVAIDLDPPVRLDAAP